jgi:hypothetical protein
MTEFYVIMQKRRDGHVYVDLHKTNQIIYLTLKDAEEAFDEMDYKLKPHFHIVNLVASLNSES